jgi:hypothetical protein
MFWISVAHAGSDLKKMEGVIGVDKVMRNWELSVGIATGYNIA